MLLFFLIAEYFIYRDKILNYTIIIHFEKKRIELKINMLCF